jgi:hypothetical protein
MHRSLLAVTGRSVRIAVTGRARLVKVVTMLAEVAGIVSGRKTQSSPNLSPNRRDIQRYYPAPKKRETSGFFCDQRYSWTKVLRSVEHPVSELKWAD